MKKLLKAVKFTTDYDHVLNHVKSTNPHKPGSPRDALIHGIGNFEQFLWSTEPVDFDLGLIAENPQLGFGVHQGNLNRYLKKIENGSIPPAIIIGIYANGRIGLLDGNHRVVAALQAGITNLPAYIGVAPEFLESLD